MAAANAGVRRVKAIGCQPAPLVLAAKMVKKLETSKSQQKSKKIGI